MLICYDGTGSGSDSKYYSEMQHSFVSMIRDHSRENNTLYFRGPNWTGLDFVMYPEGLVSLVKTSYANGDNRVFLTGYSRGGAILIATAHLLKHCGITVDAMFLFDAVDRSFRLSNTNTECIPSNVTKAYHALRADTTHSRTSFSNCGTIAERAGTLEPRLFKTTHGGMGGVPWGGAGISKPASFFTDAINENDFPIGRTTIDAATEALGMTQVQHWMWSYLRQHGVIR